jgi:hypothetical protein
MRVPLRVFSLVATTALGSPPADAQTQRPLGEASTLFDTAVAHLAELELTLLEVRAQHAAAHPSVTGVTRQIAALHELLAEFPDTAEVNAAVRAHLIRALQTRLASTEVAQRRMAARLDSSLPGVQALERKEKLLRTRLRELGVLEPD